MYLRRKILSKLSDSWMLITLVMIILLPLLVGIALYFRAEGLLKNTGLIHLLGTSEWLPHERKFGFIPLVRERAFAAAAILTIIIMIISILARVLSNKYSKLNLNN